MDVVATYPGRMRPPVGAEPQDNGCWRVENECRDAEGRLIVVEHYYLQVCDNPVVLASTSVYSGVVAGLPGMRSVSEHHRAKMRHRTRGRPEVG